MDGWVGGWMDEWVCGWMDERMEVKAVLRIAHNNKKEIDRQKIVRSIDKYIDR